MSPDPPGSTPRGRRWPAGLGALAVGYVFFHHVGTFAAPLGEVGDTRWGDWLDILTPYVIVGLAARALFRAGASTRHWVAFGAGAVLYTHGHGIHLAANSISNAAASDTAHFWDEYVGHYVAYVGLALLFAVLAAALAERPRATGAARTAAGHILASAAGLTHFTNSIQGEFAVPGMAIAAGFAAWGLRTRRRTGGLLLTAYGVALVLFAGYGGWQRGFPELSDLSGT